jgi:hypothetical protein
VGGVDRAALGAGPPLSAEALARRLKQTDVALQVIATGPTPGFLVPPAAARSPGLRAEVARVDRLSRQALAALTWSGMYRSLPTENQQDPEVEQRLDRMLPALDDAVFGMSATLAATDRSERAALQASLRREPDLPLRIADRLEAPARILDVAPASRAQMRRIIASVGWRLQKQPPSLLFDEYVAKVERVAAAHGQLEQLRRYVTVASTGAAIWRNPAAWVQVGDYTEGPRVVGEPPGTKASPLQREDPALRRARAELTAGGVVLGLGALIFGGGAVAVAGGGSIGGAVAMTIGAVLLLVGLITIIVGAWRRSDHRQGVARE